MVLFAIAIPLFYACMPMILLFGLTCFQTFSLSVLHYEEFRYSDHYIYWFMVALPYVILAGCLTFVFNAYLIVLAILAAPVGLGLMIYALTDEWRY